MLCDIGYETVMMEDSAGKKMMEDLAGKSASFISFAIPLRGDSNGAFIFLRTQAKAKEHQRRQKTLFCI
jgi:hypothetical protein